MALRVFLSYSLDVTEITLAWRLQTLAAAHGIDMYVPHRAGTEGAPGTAAIFREMDRVDCVLAILATAASPEVQQELKYALDRRKLVIPIVRDDLTGQPFLTQFNRVFTFSPWGNPGEVETQIVEFLKDQQLTRERQRPSLPWRYWAWACSYSFR